MSPTGIKPSACSEGLESRCEYNPASAGKHSELAPAHLWRHTVECCENPLTIHREHHFLPLSAP